MAILEELEPLRVAWNQIYLDPGNPRMTGTEEALQIPDTEIPDRELQESLRSKLRASEDIASLVTHMRKNGFVAIDRMVVRPLRDVEDAYVVLEGNRRTAAVRSIMGVPEVRASLDPEIRATLEHLDVLVYRGEDPQASWLIQGFRHLGGTREWGPYQQARFLSVLHQEEPDMPIGELAEKAGVGPTIAGKLMRSYRAFQQAQSHPDYGSRVSSSNFSIFSEAIFQKVQPTPIRTWLEWDERAQEFQSNENLTTLLSLLFAEEGTEPKITRVNPDLRDKFSKLVDRGADPGVLQAFLDDELSLDAAYAQAIRGEDGNVEALADVSHALNELVNVNRRLNLLPVPALLASDELPVAVERLTAVVNTAEVQLDRLERP